MLEKHEEIVQQEDADIRLDRWFKRHFPDIPHGLLQKLLRKGAIRVDGKKAETSLRIQPKQIITIPPLELTKNSKKPVKKQNIKPKSSVYVSSLIIYEDEALIAINKPHGLATQGGAKIHESVDEIFPDYKLCHRLDKDTSGILLLAKNANIAAKMTKAFQTKSMEKIYWALVVGVPKKKQGKIDSPLSISGDGGRNEKTVPDEERGKHAVTLYRKIDSVSKQLAWLELQPETGRKHQLRVHLNAISHPVLGDGKYGGKAAFIKGVAEKLHLHARQLTIPYKGKTLTLTAPLPAHMAESWDMFGFEE